MTTSAQAAATPDASAGRGPAAPVVLIGFMGAGKTSVGRALAARLGWRFTDLDERIRERAGCSIAQIFAAQGEPAFRRLETEALRALLPEMAAGQGLVAALGGGAPAQDENMRLLAAAGVRSVWLDAPVEELWRRVREAGDADATERPLAAAAGPFRRLYEERRASFQAASLRVETSGKAPQQIAAEIIEHLALQ